MRQARRLAAVTLAIGMGAAGTAGTAAAQPNGLCGSSYYDWSPHTTITTAGVAAAPASDAADTLYYPAGNPITYLAQASTLFAIRKFADDGHPGGSIKWTWQSSPPAPLPSSPNPVRTRGREVIFLTSRNGFLYKIDADQGTTLLSIDTRRTVGGVLVCADDGILATPAVQLYDLSNSAFQAAADAAGHCGDDLVFVVTANGCNDVTRNRVIACWASDLSIRWIFNADFATKVDKSPGGFTIDYATNTLFLGTDLPPAPSGQNSLFALDAITGSLSWRAHSSAVLNRPLLLAGRLYVADKPGSVMAYDPAGNGAGGGAALWASPLPVAIPGAIISRNLAHGPAAGPFAGRLLVLDSGGVLHAILDNGASGTHSWGVAAESGVQYRSTPVVQVLAGATYAYVGRDDGLIQQILLSTSPGTLQGAIFVGDWPSDVYDPTVEVEPGTPTKFRLVVAAGSGHVTRLVLPLCPSAPYY